MPKPLLTYPEAAHLLATPIGTLYSLVHQGRIPYVRLGKRFVRFDPDDLAAWIDAGRRGAGRER